MVFSPVPQCLSKTILSLNKFPWLIVKFEPWCHSQKLSVLIIWWFSKRNLDVAQARMKGVPYEYRNHCSVVTNLASQGCWLLHHVEVPNALTVWLHTHIILFLQKVDTYSPTLPTSKRFCFNLFILIFFYLVWRCLMVQWMSGTNTPYLFI